MSRVLPNRARVRTAEWNLFSEYMGDRGLVADLGRDLSTLQWALPRLYRRLADEPDRCAELMNVPAEATQSVSLQPCLQVLARLWTASRGKALGVDCAHLIRFARRFAARLLDACDQSLKQVLSTIKQGDGQTGRADIVHRDAWMHLAQIASTLALWEVKWSLLDETHDKIRSIQVLGRVLELLAHFPEQAGTPRQLLDSRYQLALASLLYAAKLDTLQQEQIHRACGLLQDIPRDVLLRCFDVGERPPGPYIVFAFNDLTLSRVNVTGLSPRLSIRVAPVQAHFMTQMDDEGHLVGADPECLASLLGQLQVDSHQHQRVIGQRRFVRVSLGASNIVHKRQEWLELLPSAEDGTGPALRASTADVGTLRAGTRLPSRQCSGNMVAIQLTPQEGVSLCLITSVATEADGTNRLQLRLLSKDWLVDRARIVDAPSGKASHVFHDIILAKRIGHPQELSMIMTADPSLQKSPALSSCFQLKSSGKVFERKGPPKHLWGAICIQVLPARPMTHAAVSFAPFLLKSSEDASLAPTQAGG